MLWREGLAAARGPYLATQPLLLACAWGLGWHPSGWETGGYPLAPLLAGLLGNLLLAQLAFFASLVGAWCLARRWLGPRESAYALWLIVCFPFSFQLSFGAPAGLSAALLVWAFVLLEEGWPWYACALAGAGCLASPWAVLGALALALRCGRRLPVTLIGVGALGALLWFWVRQGGPGEALQVDPQSLLGVVLGQARPPRWEFGLHLDWCDAGLAWGCLLLAPSVESRFGAAYAGWLLLLTVGPALAGSTSLEAPLAAAFPAFLALARLTRNRAMLVAGGMLLVYEAALFFSR